MITICCTAHADTCRESNNYKNLLNWDQQILTVSYRHNHSHCLITISIIHYLNNTGCSAIAKVQRETLLTFKFTKQDMNTDTQRDCVQQFYFQWLPWVKSRYSRSP